MIDAVSGVVRHVKLLFLPSLPFKGRFSRADWVDDLIAGVAVATVLIPQSIAYALLAGLPPAHGLYAAMVSGIAGALWGGSRYLATGPIAVMSLLTLTAISPIAQIGSAHYVVLAAGLALMTGVIQMMFGFARLGFLVRLVPISVLVGFSSGAALVIVMTQLPHFLGVPVSSGSFALQQLVHFAAHLGSFNAVTLLVGVLSLAVLVLLRVINKKIPANIIVIVMGIVATYIFDLPAYGVLLAGEIPVHLPLGDIPAVSAQNIVSLSGHAFILALVGFMSAYATVKEFSQKTKERVNADQELFAQGIANVFSGVFRGHPIGGSLSRTAVNYDAGAKSAWSNVFASLSIAVVILFFSSVLSKLPVAVLASVLLFAVVPLIDIKELRRIHRITPTDGVIGFATFFAVFVLRIDLAILLGAVLSLVMYMHKVMWVHVVEVGFHPEWRSLVARSLFPDAEVFPRMLMLRVDAPIFYANVDRLELEVEVRLAEYGDTYQNLPKILALDFSGVNHMDITGVDGFAELVERLHERKIRVFVITPRRGTREILERGNLGGKVRIVHGNRELRLIGEAMLEGRSLV